MSKTPLKSFFFSRASLLQTQKLSTSPGQFLFLQYRKFKVCLNVADLRTLSHGYTESTNPQIPPNCLPPSRKLTGKLKPNIASQKICDFAARTRHQPQLIDVSGTFLSPDLELQGCISIFIDTPCYSPIAEGHFLQEFITDIKPEAKAEKSIFPIDCFMNVFLNYFHISLTCK